MVARLRRQLSSSVVLAMLASFMMVVSATPAAAATFTVDNTGAGGVGSLRAAINQANGTAGPDDIEFAIPGPGPHTITLGATALPPITDPVSINGLTQGGLSTADCPMSADPDLRIEIDGTNLGGAGTSVLELAAGSGGSTIAGLVINGAPNAGIDIASNGNGIFCNQLGTNVAGTAAPNGNSRGVFIRPGASNNVVGTDDDGSLDDVEGNLISGNGQQQVLVQGNGNEVQGNFIGTDISGNAAIGGGSGVIVNGGASNNHVGRPGPDTGNVISGNGLHGVVVAGDTTSNNRVRGNLIGVGADGVTDVGNGLTGILVAPGNAPTNTVTGSRLNANTIAHNGGYGIAITGDNVDRHLIANNSIFDNANLGIDLGGNGVDPIDDDDVDTGPNDVQNRPVLDMSEISTGGDLLVSGSISTTPNTQITVQFFSNSACDPSGFGEGETKVGQTTFTTNGAGEASFTGLNLGATASSGQLVTATARDDSTTPANTSEFSNCIQIDGPPEISIANTAKNEGDDPPPTDFNFTVSLDHPSSQPVTVEAETADGTAIAGGTAGTGGDDYEPVAAELVTFAPGETSKTVTVDVNGDVLNEDNEAFVVNLSNPTGGVIDDGSGTGTILNDDPEPEIRIRQDRTELEGDTGTTAFNFPVRLGTAGDPTPSGKTVTVDYQVDDGTVGGFQDATTADNDYVDDSGTLTFVPGDTVEVITVQVNGDTTFELDEQFTVQLSNPTNATFASNPGGPLDTGTGTILNDDAEVTATDVDVAPTTVEYSDLVDYTATVTAEGDGTPPPTSGTVPAGTVEFFLDGTSVGTDTVDPVTGVAELPDEQVTLGQGTYTVEAEFTPDDPALYEPSSDTTTLDVVREADTTITPDPGNPTFVDPGGGPITFAVTIDEDDGADPDSALGDIGNAEPVEFTLVAQSPGPDYTCTAPPTTTVVGGPTGTLEVACTFTGPIEANLYVLEVEILGDFYTADANFGEVGVTVRQNAFLSGQGTTDGSNFFRLALRTTLSAFNGQLSYRDGTDQLDGVVDTYPIITSGGTVFASGDARLNNVPGYTFRYRAVDNGTSDEFGLQVFDPSGAPVPGLTFGPDPVTNGQIALR